MSNFEETSNFDKLKKKLWVTKMHRGNLGKMLRISFQYIPFNSYKKKLKLMTKMSCNSQNQILIDALSNKLFYATEQ